MCKKLTREEFIFNNQAKFKRDHGLTDICACLNGRCKQHKGWTFSYIKEEEIKNVKN